MKKTTIINLYAGPGKGKSTLAAGLFARMKTDKMSVELVSECAKEWAWEARSIGPIDQVTICAEQMKREARLFGKVEYIITDSPALLSAFYSERYFKHAIVKPLLAEFEQYKKNEGVSQLNLFLPVIKEYDPNGRFETEEQALDVHVSLGSWLDDEDKEVHNLSSLSVDEALNLIKGNK